MLFTLFYVKMRNRLRKKAIKNVGGIKNSSYLCSQNILFIN